MSEIGRATDAARRRIQQLKSASEAAAGSQSILLKHAKMMSRYAASAALAGGVGFGARGTYRMADAYIELNNRLRLVTHSEADLAEIRQRLYEISQITRTAIGANAALYSKFSMATRETGHSQADLLKVVWLL